MAVWYNTAQSGVGNLGRQWVKNGSRAGFHPLTGWSEILLAIFSHRGWTAGQWKYRCSWVDILTAQCGHPLCSKEGPVRSPVLNVLNRTLQVVDLHLAGATQSPAVSYRLLGCHVGPMNPSGLALSRMGARASGGLGLIGFILYLCGAPNARRSTLLAA